MIIQSLLDLDYYKITMGQFAYKYYPDVKVKYAFINRSNVKLANHIAICELIDELDNVRNLQLTMDELNYLNDQNIFSKDYLNFLSNLKLPPVYVSEKDGELIITTEGLWSEAIFWETFILSIVNELYYQNYKPTDTRITILDLLQDKLVPKIDKIIKNPFKFVEFGTRRRFSGVNQSTVLKMLQEGCHKSLIGTSNVWLAKNYKLKPVGTFAHELPMVCAGLNDDNLYTLEHSHNKMLSQWYFMYGEELSIALTDTFGSDFFFKDFTKEKAEKWKGLRQDSGDPIEFLYKACRFYDKHGIKTEDKVIVFSDGLDIDKIYKIEKEAKKNKIQTVYGWGTNLTNDVGAKPLSIVVKATEANGRPLVKLSDNTAKTLGKPKVIEKYKRAFGYDSSYSEPLYY